MSPKEHVSFIDQKNKNQVEIAINIPPFVGINMRECSTRLIFQIKARKIERGIAEKPTHLFMLHTRFNFGKCGIPISRDGCDERGSDSYINLLGLQLSLHKTSP